MTCEDEFDAWESSESLVRSLRNIAEPLAGDCGAWAQSTAPNETRTPAAAAGPKLAEEEFKNIQALKGVPADQVIPSMQFIAASLGVECEYCHVAHANEKDDKSPRSPRAR